MPEFLVHYKRIGVHRGVRRIHRAVTVGALEAPVKEEVDQILGHDGKEADITVTINAEAMVGQLDYGLKGEFEISAR